MELPSTPLDEGTCKSQPLLEGKTSDPKNSRGKDQSADKGLHSTVSNEGIGKTTPLSEGLRADKYLERLKPLVDTESQTPPVISLSGANAGYQVDQTQSTRFEAGDEMDEDIHQADEEETQSPKPSKESSTEVLTEKPTSQEHQSPTPHKEQPGSSHARDTDASNLESSSCSETFMPYDNFVPVTEREKHKEAAASYADLKWSLKDFIHASFNKYENNDTALRNFQPPPTMFKTIHNTSMRRILKNLKGVHDAVKEDPALNKKVHDAVKKDPTLNKKVHDSAKAYTKNPFDLTKLPSLAKSSTSIAWSLGHRMTNIEFTQAAIQSDNSSLKQDTFEIKSMMSEIFNAFKGQSSSASSSSMPTTTLAIIEAPTTIEEGEDVTNTTTEEPSSHTERENKDMETKKEKTSNEKADKDQKSARENRVFGTKIKLIGSLRPQPTDTILEVPQAHLTSLVTDITPNSQPKSSQATLRTDKGKEKVTDDTNESTRRLVPASKKVRQDPDEAVQIPYEIHGKLYHLTNDEIQTHLDKEEKIKKAVKEAKVLEMSKPELIKVVQ
uniref:Uncharacterized protein n=1 Tax=Tanacetum cinerariifolium TaxID=118510 RepID=A0A699I0T4_TANCI|nr:hypothetical protein [Tanacetum cinerariifolium]GEZ01711.1 hypothetical protein [Tanacetum cinerariifolium]